MLTAPGYARKSVRFHASQMLEEGDDVGRPRGVDGFVAAGMGVELSAVDEAREHREGLFRPIRRGVWLGRAIFRSLVRGDYDGPFLSRDRHLTASFPDLAPQRQICAPVLLQWWTSSGSMTNSSISSWEQMYVGFLENVVKVGVLVYAVDDVLEYLSSRWRGPCLLPNMSRSKKGRCSGTPSHLRRLRG